MNKILGYILYFVMVRNCIFRLPYTNNDKMMLRYPKSKQLKHLYITESKFKDRTISHIINEENKSNIDVIYFHGGCYALQMQSIHWDFTTFIARETGANVYVVDYPLIPEHHSGDAINYVYAYYKHHIQNSNNPIIILGDSSGAGLATSLCMMIRDNKLRQANRLILLSPYLDTLCTDPRQLDYQSKDFLLTVKELSRAGRIYIGALEKDDYRVNPIHGNFKGLPPMIIFTSDRDILHVDSIRLVKILEDSNITYELYEQKNVMHDWILIDQLPEAIKAREKLKEYILSIINS